MAQTYSTAEVGKHKDKDSGIWIIIENDVYDVSQFIDEHPGGPRVIQRFAGKNATKAFWKYHGDSVLAKYGDKYKIGAVEESAKL
ncbi:Putative Cytochrome b5-like Heme/Steroid binding domain containing protein [[Torrubiella] hemipterigena]|uniref:Putative Cytochrome b5-like Heme/Steroid binding domain containing protein n=1 Tax=[Torrubiella] hemipterigena TaxID=1531966 RepID=A0A0A1TAV0_9HYPO|nr:Putative Cytochrome b5-like Heme/Steroid binding domain containing protein [[Torrubiella] hemipterigena]